MDESVSSDPIENMLKHVSYPIGRDELARTARDEDLDPEVVARVENLPQKTYADAAEVRQTFANLTPDSTRTDAA
jgi:hypothetical protein